MIKIAVVNPKGGVGKTTLTANLGALLAALGIRVLMVDCDVQPALSSFFDISKYAPCGETGRPQGLTKLLVDGAVSGDVISHTHYENLDIVISDDPQAKLPDWILHTPDGRFRMRFAMQSIDDAELYDVALIDTQGAIGALLDTAVLAADFLISPVPPEMLSAREFMRGGVQELYARLKPMEKIIGVKIAPMKAVIYRQTRLTDAKNVADGIREAFLETNGRVIVLDTVIPDAKAYLEATTRRIPVHLHEPSRSGPMPSASQTMHEFVWELFPNLRGHVAQGFAEGK